MVKCLILNGASSSGKTSISQELQKLIPELAHIQIDNIAELYFNIFSHDYEHTAQYGEKRYKRQVAIRNILLNTALTLLRQGFDVCIDTGFDGPYSHEHMQFYLTKLKMFKPVFIGVICELSMLEEREKVRNDRPLGLARSQIEEGIHDNRPYSFTVDNTINSAKENAQIIYKKLFKDLDQIN